MTPVLARMVARKVEQGQIVLRHHCDGDGPDGDGCDAVIEATRRGAHAKGWRVAWRAVPGTGVELQVELCPRCRASKAASVCRLAVGLELVMQEEARRAG